MKGTKLKTGLVSLLLATGISTQAQATTVFDPCVTRHGGFYIDLEGFNAKATETFFSNFGFADVEIEIPNDTGGNTDREVFAHFDPQEDWGGRIALGYDFPSCCPCNYGLSLEYTYFNTDDKQHREISGVVTAVTNTFIAIETNLARFGGLFDTVDAKLDHKYQTLDLLAHDNFILCRCIDAQFFVGARFIRFDEESTVRFFRRGPQELNSNLENLTDFDNKFTGVGPRVGLAGFYPFFKNFGLTAEIAGNALYGCSKSNLTASQINVGFSSTSQRFIDVFESHLENTGKFVTGVSGKVALAFRTRFNNCSCSSLAIELGYRGDKYFEIANDGAFMQQLFDDATSTVKDSLYHDFEIAGPYLSVAFHV